MSALTERQMHDLAGRLTRRVVKPPRNRSAFVLLDHGKGWWPYQSDDGESELCDDGMEHPYTCPYGQPGDRLWVREAWRTISDLDAFSGSEIAEKCVDAGYQKPWAPLQFEADGQRHNWEHTSSPPHDGPPRPGRYRHARFMPRWASRILLEVTAVRVERLQDISIEDAKAEVAWPDSSVVDRCMAYFGIDALAVNPRLAFRMVWEQINGPGSWDANPWVWVVEFKRVTP